ncbi:glucosamine-6-phosphate deaminase [Sutcliffiella horikoshii]|uniref:Glucosamine-6-phosphate deaminase n=1 Tax=Sutcliffiella horikoshii TaxID=79883 RepID=A0AA94WU03_9BACI|nr:glucosamine-6-phosphate deaminase [Sutcliffiella horikoshii]TYS61378.1 glucosamine-6-phosphate deaminase [Sutcliffiella horikoshii]
MDIITTPSYEALSKEAASYVSRKVQENPHIVLGLATGSTPTGMYEQLIKDHITLGTSYRNVTTFNLDEYVGMSKKNPNSYYAFMEKHLFQHLDIQNEFTFIPDGMSGDPQKECGLYEEKLSKHGPIDLQILGLGANGHIGFNEPGTSFSSRTHVVELTDSTRKANSRFFKGIEDVPTHAITMGIDSIMDAKEILLLVAGANKREAFEKLLYGEISDNFPASILKKHPCVKILADQSVLDTSSIIA